MHFSHDVQGFPPADVLTMNEYNTVTIRGKNFHPGVIAHVSDAGVKVDMIEYMSKSKIIPPVFALQLMEKLSVGAVS